MSAVYGFGSNAHDNFGLGPDVVQVETPIKLKHPQLVQANWSQAMFRSDGGEMVYTGLRDPSPVQTALPDDLLLGPNEWSAAHSKQTGHIIRLCDGTKSVSAFDKVAVNGVGEVLAVEFTSPPTLTLFPSLESALVHSSPASPAPLSLPFPVARSTPTHPVTLHPGLSHFLLHAPPHHLLALGDNRFFQSSSLAPPLPGLLPTPVPELEGLGPVACAAGGRHSAAVSGGGEAWVWGGGPGAKGRVKFEGEEGENVDVRGVSCGQDHTVVWTDKGVWASGGNTFGQLGLGDTAPREEFVRLAGLDGCGEVERVVCTRWSTFVQVRES